MKVNQPHCDASDWHLRTIAASLAAAGTETRLHDSDIGQGLTARLCSASQDVIKVAFDRGTWHAELRLRASPAAVAVAVVDAAGIICTVAMSHSLSADGSTEPLSEAAAGYDGPVTEGAGDGGMARPQDRVVNPTTGLGHGAPDQTDLPPRDNGRSESGAPRETRPDGPRIAFQERLRHLPPNHPSSPHHGDGSRERSASDEVKEERPRPKEAKPAPETVSATQDLRSEGLATEDRPRTDPDGSWHWKGRELLPERSRIADRAIEERRAAEGRDVNGRYGERGLTPAMLRVEPRLEHGKLVEETERYALKSPDRFKEKLARLVADEPDAEVQELVYRINDGIRYTFCFPEETYPSDVMDLCETMSADGFELYERKNAWTDQTKSYQGVNTTWRDWSSGLLFEVQAHTDASWAAKQESHREYEVIESLHTTSEEKMTARERQDRIFAQAPVPPNVESITSYRKDGW